MPDGTCFGPATQVGRKPTQDVLARFGRAFGCRRRTREDNTVKIAFHLRRRPESAPATALLLLSHDPAKLLHLCVRLGHDPLPRLYRVADGFLVKLAQPMSAAVGGVLRLRCIANNLYLPVDADLVPALLPMKLPIWVAGAG